ncbi:MAG: adenosine-specific kinase [Thermoplasmata archaeon]|nr:adenosine-specific kinase [Thermoplasmata archaeon]
MELRLVDLKKPEDDINIVIGQTHFIKTVEDVYEAIITTVPNAKFGIAFNEASGKRLIRYEGNDEILVKYAIENAKEVGAGHVFVILLKNAYPINIINRLKETQEILNIFAASANPLKVIVAIEKDMRAVLGVMDGQEPLGIENEHDKEERKRFLRKIGYKF